MSFCSIYRSSRHPRSLRVITGRSPTYCEKVVDGVNTLVQDGTTNVTAFVEAVFDETLIYNLIDRFNRGDLAALSGHPGIYGDFSSVPCDLIESFNMIKKVERDFSALPVEIKAHYDNSVYKFAQAIDSGEFQHFVQKMSKPGATKTDESNQNMEVNIDGK